MQHISQDCSFQDIRYCPILFILLNDIILSGYKGTLSSRLLKTQSAQLGSVVTKECTHEEFCDVILTRDDCNIFQLISQGIRTTCLVNVMRRQYASTITVVSPPKKNCNT